MRLGRPAAILAAVLAGVCACGPGSTGAPRSPSPPTSASSPLPSLAAVPDWPTYHGDLARSGTPPGPAPTFRSAARDWATGTLDGDVYASPIVAGGLVLVATENDTLYAFDAVRGTPRWSRHLAEPVDASTLPCGNILPVSGITGTPVADVAHGLVYVVAFVRPAQHVLYTVDLTGEVRGSRPVDPPGDSPRTEQQRGALTLSGGTVYVPYGGLFGDCGQYHGWVVGAPAGGGALTSYQVPCHRECGLWAPGGPSVDGSGDLWVASGNGDSTTSFDYGNAVLRLSPDLKLRDWFAPSDWASLNRSDQDLGSISPALLGDGPAWISGKGGTGYLLRRDNLGHVGGQAASGPACPSFGGTAYAAQTLYVACSGELLAVRVDASGRGFSVRWRKPLGSPGAPIVANGAVWVVDVAGGSLLALDAADGRQLFSDPGGPAAHFATAAASGSVVYAALGRRVVAVRARTSG
jgi:outer membrane protein assembly factor BamB